MGATHGLRTAAGGLGRDSNVGHGAEEGSGQTPRRAGGCWVIAGTWPSPHTHPAAHGARGLFNYVLVACRKGGEVFSRPAFSSLRFLEAPSSFSEAGHSCASSPVVHAGGFWLLMGIVCLFVAGLVLVRFRHAAVQGGGAWHPWRGVLFVFFVVSHRVC